MRWLHFDFATDGAGDGQNSGAKEKHGTRFGCGRTGSHAEVAIVVDPRGAQEVINEEEVEIVINTVLVYEETPSLSKNVGLAGKNRILSLTS